jgi:hypothetical protein
MEHTGVRRETVSELTLRRRVRTHRKHRHLRRFHIMFVRVNAIALGRRARTRDAIGAVRHVFLDADHDGLAVLSRVEAGRDLPIPSYVNLGESDRGRVLRALEAHERPLPRVTITQGLRELGGGGPANLPLSTSRAVKPFSTSGLRQWPPRSAAVL